jgi:uncharacterized repeat protein (TIGR01451 family)
MNRNRRLGGYLLAVLALLGAVLGGPRAWATASQARPGQGISVPTPTPVREWSPQPPTAVPPTDRPTDRPSGSDTATPPAPGATPTAPARLPSPIPAASVTPGVRGSGAALTLVKEVDRLEAWPGATVWFTLILSNPGAASARQIVLEDDLPTGLDPGRVQGTSAAWDGRTLRGLVSVLPPGGRWAVTFSAIVREDVAAGRLVVNSAQASAAGGLSARAEAYLALPPPELPAVGGRSAGGRVDELRLLP